MDRSRQQRIGTPVVGSSPHTGPLAAAAWLIARELVADSARWSVQIVFDSDDRATFELDDRSPSTRFQLEVYAEEWGFVFRHDRRMSWIRVTDIPFVHGRDEHALLRHTPTLRELGSFVRNLEARFGIQLPRTRPQIRATVPDAEPALRRWALEL